MPSSSALAWIGFARSAIDAAVAGGDDQQTLTPEVEAQMRGLLDSWEADALEGPVLSLSFEIPLEEAEFLVHAFLRLSAHWTTAADRRGFDVSPPEGDEFYGALVDAVIAAMEVSEEQSGMEFGTTLRTIWPRFDRLDGQPGGEHTEEERPPDVAPDPPDVASGN